MFPTASTEVWDVISANDSTTTLGNRRSSSRRNASRIRDEHRTIGV
jgi:hypothetical protein